ncbi:replication protein P [Marinibactrum halimedae]|uniref:Replicative helicase inhibitor G39P N-terminal domain-containing protein n=1 Tax=Marinibactrum halimedae TaxID=1444977 RepID=A0AA37T2L2_9GAMM|nr:replication protein P [Marinibactrum halimedae]MCD9458741.1 hypothetical protein [Marinibactrum halimedae]GLS25298.1 hypothetical protein GCM10007877_10120 [Marinibactrum halimedae]
MKDSNQLINNVEHEISHSKKASPTAAGPTNSEHGNPEQTRPSPQPVWIDTINQVFALLKISYHNQYYSAFREQSIEIQAKRLWLESLCYHFEPAIILRATKTVIAESEYLPTLHKMLRHCRNLSHDGLPEPRAAYVEACQAPSPKAGFTWSHPAVYFAGRESDWFFLGNTPEHIAYPVFARHYEDLCQRLLDGEKLPPIERPQLPQTIETPLSKQENKEKLKVLREQLDL